MRSLTLLATAGLLLTALALPPASAAPCQALGPSTGSPTGDQSVDFDADCNATVTLNDGIGCFGSAGTADVDAGAAHVIASYCRGPPQSASAGPEICPSVQYGVAELTTGCQVVVTIGFVQCVWGGYWVEKGAGPVTVRYYTCSGAPPS